MFNHCYSDFYSSAQFVGLRCPDRKQTQGKLLHFRSQLEWEPLFLQHNMCVPPHQFSRLDLLLNWCSPFLISNIRITHEIYQSISLLYSSIHLSLQILLGHNSRGICPGGNLPSKSNNASRGITNPMHSYIGAPQYMH